MSNGLGSRHPGSTTAQVKVLCLPLVECHIYRMSMIHPHIEKHWTKQVQSKSPCSLNVTQALHLIMGFSFLMLSYLFPSHPYFNVGASFNAWISIFNLIPFGVLDGQKIFNWNKIVWICAIICASILFIISYGQYQDFFVNSAVNLGLIDPIGSSDLWVNSFLDFILSINTKLC